MKRGDFIKYRPYPIMDEYVEGGVRMFVVKTPQGEHRVNASICELLPKRSGSAS